MLRRFVPIAAAISAATVGLLAPQSAQAIAVAPTPPVAPILGTGQGMAPGTLDPVWKVTAVPSSYVPPSPTPYSAFVLQNTTAAYTGGGTPQAGVSTIGIPNYWVAPNSIAGDVGPGFWILSQDFTVPTSGDYMIRLKGMVDDRATLYLGGTIGGVGTQFPNIFGGTLLGTLNSYETFSNIDQVLTLNAGTQTINIVVANDTGASAILVAPLYVPGPLPIVGIAAAFGASRRLKRRIQVGASGPA